MTITATVRNETEVTLRRNQLVVVCDYYEGLPLVCLADKRHPTLRPAAGALLSDLAPGQQGTMLKRGVFKDTPAARATELIYWRFGGADPTPRAVKLESTAEEAGEEALANLRALLKRYAAPEQAFLSKPRVLRVRIYDDYDQLARRQEWADAEGEE